MAKFTLTPGTKTHRIKGINKAWTYCNVPKVTLLGTEQDYIDLRNKVDVLTEFDFEKSSKMKKWKQYLIPVLDKLVESVQGADTFEFW